MTEDKNATDKTNEEIFEKGEPTDSKYANGPVEDRSCTDILCCLVFVGFIVGMVYVTIVAFSKGEPEHLLAPFASDGTQCGWGANSDIKYLFLPKLLENGGMEIFENSFCVTTCPLSSDETAFSGVSLEYRYNSEPYFERYCLPNKEGAEKLLKNLGVDKVGQYLSDLYLAWKVLLIAVGLALVFAMVYMILLRCCAKLLVWVTFLGFLVLLAVLGFFFYDKSQNSLDEGDELNYKVLAIICWAVDGIILLAIICLFDDIQLALNIITTAATFVFSNVCLILVPIVSIIVTCGFFVYWIATIVYLYSIGDIKQYSGTAFATVEWDEETTNLWYYQLFALFWVVAFIIAALQFIIAATAAQWYFSSNSDENGSGSICKSLYWTIRYHLGSLAFGSLILAIVMFVRFIFEYMKKKLEAGGAGNRFTKCLLGCASCCLKCIGECILFLTKNAYIQVAIRSICFCCAAREAFRLVLRNIVRFTLVNAFAGIFTFFGKLLIGLGTAFVCWFLLTEWEEVKDELYSVIVPTIACFIIGYVLGNLFLTVYDLSCSAILQCFLIDEETPGVAGKNRPAALEPFINNLREAVPNKK